MYIRTHTTILNTVTKSKKKHNRNENIIQKLSYFYILLNKTTFPINLFINNSRIKYTS